MNGGAELAVTSMWLDAHPVWFAEVDKHAAKVLAARWPGVPNLGDVTVVDWATVPAVDVLTGGFPCQDLSHAGKRLGLRPGTRSGLWEHMAYAVDQLRPRLVLIENVRGLLSAAAHSDVERDCWCVGDDREPDLRALGAVLGDLADIGFDAEWTCVRASDVGAPHRRERVFVAAYPGGGSLPGAAGEARTRLGRGSGGDADPRADLMLPTPTSRDWKGANQRGDDTCLAGALLPTPKASDGPNGGPGMRNGRGEADALPGAVVALLPTPAVNDMGAGKTPDEWDAWTAAMRDRHANGNGHGASLAVEAQRLLPTPSTVEIDRSPDEWRERHAAKAADGVNVQQSLAAAAAAAAAAGEALLLPTPPAQSAKHAADDRGQGTLDDANLWAVVTRDGLLGTPTANPDNVRSPERRQGREPTPGEVVAGGGDFGPYTAAIRRWEPIIGRPAPSPTEPGKDDRPRLSPAFVEWLMGLPDGWVTGVPGLTRNAQLKALGNGIVPQQMALAVRLLLAEAVAA